MESSLDNEMLLAIKAENLKLVSELLSKGANPNNTVSTGMTCLGEAIVRGLTDIAKLLIADSHSDKQVLCGNEKESFTPLKKKLDMSSKYTTERAGKQTLCKSSYKLGHGFGSSSEDSKVQSSQSDLEWDEDIDKVAANTKEDDMMEDMHQWYATILETTGAVLAAALNFSCGIDQVDSFGETALSYACDKNNLEIFKALIEAGCKIDTPRMATGWTVLHSACKYERLQFIEVLLAAGFDVNRSTLVDTTALHIAVCHSLETDISSKTSSATTTSLASWQTEQLEYPSTTERQHNFEKNNALYTLIDEDKSLRHLLSNRKLSKSERSKLARVVIPHLVNKTPGGVLTAVQIKTWAEYAIEIFPEDDITFYFFTVAPTNSDSTNQECGSRQLPSKSRQYYGCFWDRWNNYRKVLKENNSITCNRRKDSVTSTSSDNLSSRASANLAPDLGPENQNILKIAEDFQGPEITEYLLDAWNKTRKERLDVLANGTTTAEYISRFQVLKNQNVAVKLTTMLVDHGANLELRDNGERTALFLAARKGRSDIVGFLISRGARFNVEDWQGHTPLCLAVRCNHIDTASILLQSGARLKHFQCMLHYTVREGRYYMTKLLADHGCGLNIHNFVGDTPLLIAMETEHPLPFVRLLLSLGANVNACNSNSGASVLHVAVGSPMHPKEFEAVLNILLDHSIDIDIRSSTRITALNQAILLCKDEFAMQLIRYGADVNIYDLPRFFHGCNPMNVFGRNNELAHMLIKAGHKTIGNNNARLNLANICRIRIRNMRNRKNLRDFVRDLPIPILMKNFLMMEEFVC